MKYLKKAFDVLLNEIIILKHASKKRNKNIWVFGEWFGTRCCDNCLYLANFVSENYPKITVYWVAKKECDISLLNKKIKIIEYDSKASMEVFNIAGVAVMNQGFGDFSKEAKNYFAGALTINLWHGIPWKKIGHDAAKKKGIIHQINTYIVDHQFGSELYLSLSGEYNKIAETAFHAKRLIKSGAPRNCLFYKADIIQKCREKILKRVEEISEVSVDSNTKIITYMPTFRDLNTNNFSMNRLMNSNSFRKWIEDENIIILQRMHYMNSNNQNDTDTNRIMMFNDFTSQEILAATDMLITDYSSCFFDYLLLDRPIVHFLYDYEYYSQKDRGLYYDWKEVVGGDVVTDVNELEKVMRENIYMPDKCGKLREKRRNYFLEYESKDACENVAKNIISMLG